MVGCHTRCSVSRPPNSPFTGRYAAHLRRQDADVRLFLADESLLLQPALDYGQVTGLSSEERERLARARPISIVSFDPICSFGFSDIRGRAPQNEWKG
jgi:tRNA U34 5-carboxymethylaminomethyl modifying enzyme MnmG/GidA